MKIYTLKNAFNDAYNAMAAHILIQSSGAELFSETALYNPSLGVFEGTFSLDLGAVENTIDNLNLSGVALTQAWTNIIRLIDHTVELDRLSNADLNSLKALVSASSGASLELQSILDIIYEPVGVGLNGTENNDTLIGGAGNDSLSTGGGNDRVYGRQGRDSMDGGEGNDRLYGEAGDDNIRGGNGNDYLHGGSGDDTLQGGNGNDIYYYNSGIDTILESEGSDTIRFANSIDPDDMAIDFSDTNKDDIYIYFNGNLAIRIENYFTTNGGAIEFLEFGDGTTLNLSDITGLKEGTSGNDNLVGNDLDSFPHDTLIGLDGNDRLTGGLGNDVLKGGRGDDRYYVSSGTDFIEDQSGNDRIIFGAGLTSANVSYEVEGDNMFVSFDGERYARIENQFTSSGAIERFTFADKTINTSSIRLIQNGTDGNDSIRAYQYGASEHNRIYAGDGNDTVYGYDGNDVLYGQAGNDRLFGGDGNDFIFGDYQTNNGGTIVSGGDDILHGGGSAYKLSDMTLGHGGSNGRDLNIYFGTTLTATISSHFTSSNSIETLKFSNGDSFELSSYQNIEGDEANNTLNGINDNYLKDDYIYGRGGNDRLNGGLGDDHLFGGYGNDGYIYTAANNQGSDTISDDEGRDYIVLGSKYTQANTTLECWRR